MTQQKTSNQFASENAIAIIGMSCRFPGGITSLEDYWQVLSEGRDVVTEVPTDRFGTDFYQHPNRKALGKSVTFSAGVLDDVMQFDAGFFGISPREADQMDPQQRLLLELTWEAIENAGIKPSGLSGSDCAVYVGIASTDYLNRRVEDPASMDAYTMTGNTASIASNRISYLLDLHGPSVSVDTACSSSLVAVHHACEAIRSGQSTSALAAGVNMLLHPFAFVGFSHASMLSANGRCRAFDAEGDGYVRAEGAAVLYLKSLAQAELDGDRIHAVIRATGINADGKTQGMTVPSHERQAKLLKKIYGDQGLNPDDLVYLEAHGTGTSIGDPIETKAIGEALAQGRHSALKIGSAKTNLGHMETASGMAGLLKSILILKHQEIPPSLHFDTPNPNIDFQGLNLSVAQNSERLDKRNTQLIGVNSFGFGGANAHVVIDQYAAQRKIAPPLRDVATLEHCPPLYLSAQTMPALQAAAKSYSDKLETSPIAPYDVAWAALTRRDFYKHGAIFFAKEPSELRASLRDFAEGDTKRDDIALAQRNGASKSLALVFTGNGCQWQGMGCELYQNQPLFKKTFDSVDHLFGELSDERLVDLLFLDEENSELARTEIAQPLLFAIQVATVELLRQQGTQFQAVVGHSVGEVAAVWAAGLLTLKQAVSVVFHRSRAQAKTRGMGRMAAIGIGRDVFDILQPNLTLGADLFVAGENSPQALTISGTLEALTELGDELKSQGVFYRLLDLDYAFHSPVMDAVESDILQSLADLGSSSSTSEIACYSTVYGELLGTRDLDAQYWWENIRCPVAFRAAIEAMLTDGFNHFLEVGPNGILRSYLRECAVENKTTISISATGRVKQEHPHGVSQAAFTAFLQGAELDWGRHFDHVGEPVELPNYPWQRERYWYPLTVEGADLINRSRIHPILGYPVRNHQGVWDNQLDVEKQPWLKGHQVGGGVVVPAAAYIDALLAFSQQQFPAEKQWSLEQVEVRAPILLDDESKLLRTQLDLEDGRISISSKTRLSEDPWVQNVQGRLLGISERSRSSNPVFDIEAFKSKATTQFSDAGHYALTDLVGLNYQGAFRAVEQVWLNGHHALAKLAIDESIAADLQLYVFHPALLDAGFQVLVDILHEKIESGENLAMIPIQIGEMHFYEGKGIPSYVDVRLTKTSPRSALVDYYFRDDGGQVIAALEDCRFKAMRLLKAQSTYPSAYQFISQPMPHDDGQSPIHWNGADIIAAFNQGVSNTIDGQSRQHHFEVVLPLLDVLATRYAWDTISSLWPEECNEQTLSQAMFASQVLESHAPLFSRLLSLLKLNDLATENAGLWTLAAECELPEAELIWQTILADSPAHMPELMRLSQIGEKLARYLTRADEQWSDSPAHKDLTQHWLEASPTFAAVNSAIVSACDLLAKSLPSGKRAQILVLSPSSAAIVEQWMSLANAPSDWWVLSKDKVLLDQLEYAQLSNQRLHPIQWNTDSDFSLEVLKGVSIDWLHIADPIFPWLNNADLLSELQVVLATNALVSHVHLSLDETTEISVGIQPDWWVLNEDGESAVPNCLSAQDWLNELKALGFKETEIWHEDFGGVTQGAACSIAFNTVAQTNEAQFEHRFYILAGRYGYAAELSQVLYDSLNAMPDVSVTMLGRDPDWEQLAFQDSTLIHLLGIDQHFDEDTDFATAQARRCVTAMELAQQLNELAVPPKLMFVTQNGSTHPEFVAEANPNEAALWGLGRVLNNEMPDLNLRMVDILAPQNTQQAGQWLLEACLSTNIEPEVQYNPLGRHVLRMVPDTLLPKLETQQDLILDFSHPGPLKNLYWKTLADSDLAPDMMEIRPDAAGLNFRDVMYAMGMLSDEAVENGFAGASLGMELAGEVLRVGSEISEFSAGDKVMGFAPACFSTRVVTQATAITHCPADWSATEAATIPTTFFTVYYALKHLAQLAPGERILIHGAAGGVGLAAIQYASYVGAEIFATAGSDHKRHFVRLMGADHVLDSRSLKFANDILALTNGEGIDVVLNSIDGEAINRNFKVLRPFGRFLELGKRDFYANSRIGLRPFRNNISYFGIDADQLLIERPQLASNLFQEMMALFSAGELQPLPHRVFPARDIHNAFRYMQQSQQIGKVVVDLRDTALPNQQVTTTEKSLELDPDAYYLVTGGLNGFGLRTAQWLAENGAKHLLLLSRRGLTEENKPDIHELERTGVVVTPVSCDVTDYLAVNAAIKSLTVPLKGIIHAAMVLDDRLIKDLDAQSWQAVVQPKLQGAWNLHQASQHCELDFFVMYSSITTFLGNPGQANYVAANMGLEQLVQYRRGRNLPASFVAWGAIDDVGYLTDNEAIKDALESRTGGAALKSERALKALGQLISHGRSGLALADLDWHAVKRYMPAALGEQYEVMCRFSGNDSEDSHEDFARLIEGMNDAEIEAFIADLLVTEVSQILRIAKEQISLDQSVFDLGMDSLMGMELVLAIEDRFGVRLPVMAISESATINRIAVKICHGLKTSDSSADDSEKATEEVAEVVRKHGSDLSDEQISAVAEQVTQKGQE